MQLPAPAWRCKEERRVSKAAPRCLHMIYIGGFYEGEQSNLSGG